MQFPAFWSGRPQHFLPKLFIATLLRVEQARSLSQDLFRPPSVTHYLRFSPSFWPSPLMKKMTIEQLQDA